MIPAYNKSVLQSYAQSGYSVNKTMPGPVIATNVRYQVLWDRKASRLAPRAIVANTGNRVLMKIPSNCARKPSPAAAASEPRAGKQETQPIAAINVPSAPVLSNKRLNQFIELPCSVDYDKHTVKAVPWYGVKY